MEPIGSSRIPPGCPDSKEYNGHGCVYDAGSASSFHHDSVKICFKDKGEELFHNLKFC